MEDTIRRATADPLARRAAKAILSAGNEDPHTMARHPGAVTPSLNSVTTVPSGDTFPSHGQPVPASSPEVVSAAYGKFANARESRRKRPSAADRKDFLETNRDKNTFSAMDAGDGQTAVDSSAAAAVRAEDRRLREAAETFARESGEKGAESIRNQDDLFDLLRGSTKHYLEVK